MAQFTHSQYDALERAIADGTRISVYRRGTEYIVVPERLRMTDGGEAIEAIHPTTGDAITFFVDDIDTLEVLS